MSKYVVFVFMWCVLVSSVAASALPEVDVVIGPNTAFNFRNGRPRARKWNTLTGDQTIFFAHRGETVLLPGHTVPAYEVAAIEQAEYVEPDLVITKDGHLVCYHDVTLKRGTDVEDHDEFDSLKTNYSGVIGDVYEDIVDDYFVQDFTLDQLKKLHVKQRRDGIRPRYFDTFGIPTFQEYLEVVHKTTITLNKTIGIIPELKHARFHNNRNGTVNLMEDTFLAYLERHGYPTRSGVQESCTGQSDMDDPTVRKKIKCPPVIIQSFEKGTLEYLSTKTSLDLMMLVDPVVSLLTYKGMESVAEIAKWMCPWKEYIYAGVQKQLEFMGKTWDKEEVERLGGFVEHDKFVQEAHRLGMKMSIFTINDSREKSNWGCAVVSGCNPEDKRAELFHYFDMGMDGIFVENVPESRELRMIYEYEELRPPTDPTPDPTDPTDPTPDGAINIAPVSLLSIVGIQVCALAFRQVV